MLRLIDADELPIRSIDATDLPKDKGLLVVLKEDIDNAPTVEPCYQTTSCLDCGNYDRANYYCPRFCEVIREIAKENQRPRGEWTNTSPYDDKGECSLCCYLSKKYYHFCPNCGADMRGSENNK